MKPFIEITNFKRDKDKLIDHLRYNEIADPEFIDSLENIKDQDREFWMKLWDRFDISWLIFSDIARVDVIVKHSSDDYEKGGIKYNFVLENVIMAEFMKENFGQQHVPHPPR